jgi:restriction modification system DNA specificity protein
MDDIRASGRILNDSTLHITPQAVKKNGLFKANSIILATSATVGEHAFLQQDSLANQRFTNFEIRDSLKEQLLPKFVFYYFFLVDEWCKQHLVIGNFPSVDVQQLISLPFSIPPLRVQSRIVEILDKFTQLEAQLEAELQAELEARNKQYDFYRNRLLDFALRDDLKGQVEWKTLGEVCENLDSQRRPITSSKRIKGIYPYYGASGIVDFVESYIYDGDYLLVSEDGANLLARNTPIAFSISGKNWVNNHAHVLKFDTYEGRKFVEYYLNHIDLKPYISGAAQPKLNQNNLNSIPIPLPPLSEQRRIVDILDRFDTLTNSISEGLPREIALRRKQYEYYRDALLRFPPPAPTA